MNAIGSLQEAGSTNMEADLRLGYQIAADEVGKAEEVRVMLFTDAQPNVGASGASEFELLTQEAADERAFSSRLLQLMREGAHQESFYGGF